MIDRGRDVADVFTATVGIGAGAKARIGPLQLGLLGCADVAGIRLGQWYYVDSIDQHENHLYPFAADGALLIVGAEASSGGQLALKRNKTYFAVQPFLITMPCSQIKPKRKYSVHPVEYFTQFEMVLAVGPSLRLGFNPGELLDFILGWGKVDIYDDDVEIKKIESNHGLESTSAPPAAGTLETHP